MEFVLERARYTAKSSIIKNPAMQLIKQALIESFKLLRVLPIYSDQRKQGSRLVKQRKIYSIPERKGPTANTGITVKNIVIKKSIFVATSDEACELPNCESLLNE